MQNVIKFTLSLYLSSSREKPSGYRPRSVVFNKGQGPTPKESVLRKNTHFYTTLALWACTCDCNGPMIENGSKNLFVALTVLRRILWWRHLLPWYPSEDTAASTTVYRYPDDIIHYPYGETRLPQPLKRHLIPYNINCGNQRSTLPIDHRRRDPMLVPPAISKISWDIFIIIE